MNSKIFLSAAIIGAMTLVLSCSKDSGTTTPDTSPNTGQANMTYQLKAANTTGNTQRTTAGGTIVWNSGFANPTQIKFEAKQQNSKNKIEYKSTNYSGTPIDLFAPVPTDFGGLVLPAGTYKEIELKLRLERVGATPALLLGGIYTDNMGSIPIQLRVDDDIELKTEVKDVTLDNSTTVAAITSLDLASYTGMLSESMIRNATLTNGTLVISRDSNRDLYNMIISSISGKRHRCEYKHHK
jgi:hypothetical protein